VQEECLLTPKIRCGYRRGAGGSRKAGEADLSKGPGRKSNNPKNLEETKKRLVTRR